MELSYLAVISGLKSSLRKSIPTRENHEEAIYLNKLLGTGERRPFNEENAKAFLKEYYNSLIKINFHIPQELKDIIEKKLFKIKGR